MSRLPGLYTVRIPVIITSLIIPKRQSVSADSAGAISSLIATSDIRTTNDGIRANSHFFVFANKVHCLFLFHFTVI